MNADEQAKFIEEYNEQQELRKTEPRRVVNRKIRRQWYQIMRKQLWQQIVQQERNAVASSKAVR